MHMRRIIPTTITIFFLCIGLLTCDWITQNTFLSLDLSRELRKHHLVFLGKGLGKKTEKTDTVHHNLLADSLILLAPLSADHQRNLQAGEASPFYCLPMCKVTPGPPNKLAASQLAGRYYSHQSEKKSKQCQTRLWLPLPRSGYLDCWNVGRTTNQWLWLRVWRDVMLGSTSRVPYVLLNFVFLMRLWPTAASLVHDGSAPFSEDYKSAPNCILSLVYLNAVCSNALHWVCGAIIVSGKAAEVVCLFLKHCINVFLMAQFLLSQRIWLTASVRTV